MKQGRTIGEAICFDASLRFWGFKAEVPLSSPPAVLEWTKCEWDSLSPGMKREIERDLMRRGQIELIARDTPVKQTLNERRVAIEYGGRKRL